MATSKSNSFLDNLTDLDVNVGSSERIASAVAGAGLIAYALKRGDMTGALLAVLGGSLAFRGTTGHCHAYQAAGIDTSDASSSGVAGGRTTKSKKSGFLDGKVEVEKAVNINKSPAELYTFWRNFGNLPQFMNHLESVQVLDDKRSHWKAKAPLGTSVEWDAEITEERDNERIAWRSTEGSEIPNSGWVEFRPTAERGTEVKVFITYEPPAGQLGALVAKLFGEEPNQQVSEDLKRFKKLMETGTIITVEGQPSGRESGSDKSKKAGA